MPDAIISNQECRNNKHNEPHPHHRNARMIRAQSDTGMQEMRELSFAVIVAGALSIAVKAHETACLCRPCHRQQSSSKSPKASGQREIETPRRHCPGLRTRTSRETIASGGIGSLDHPPTQSSACQLGREVRHARLSHTTKSNSSTQTPRSWDARRGTMQCTTPQ